MEVSSAMFLKTVSSASSDSKACRMVEGVVGLRIGLMVRGALWSVR